MTSAERPITVEELRRKAVRIKDMTAAEVRHLQGEQATKIVLVGVGAVCAAVALGYYLGRRSRG